VTSNNLAGPSIKEERLYRRDINWRIIQPSILYKIVAPGTHKLSTESEFSENHTELKTEGGKNYFVEQSIKMGVFVGGAAEFQLLAPTSA